MWIDLQIGKEDLFVVIKVFLGIPWWSNSQDSAFTVAGTGTIPGLRIKVPPTCHVVWQKKKKTIKVSYHIISLLLIVIINQKICTPVFHATET